MGIVQKDNDSEESDEKTYTAELAKSVGLPTEGWRFDPEGGAYLTCSTFRALITSGGQAGNGILITDRKAEAEKEKRME